MVLNNREVSLCKSRSVYNNCGLFGTDLSSTHFRDDEITSVFQCPVGWPAVLINILDDFPYIEVKLWF